MLTQNSVAAAPRHYFNNPKVKANRILGEEELMRLAVFFEINNFLNWGNVKQKFS